jgi:hypothetical protein
VGVRVEPEMVQSPEGVKLRLPVPDPPEVRRLKVCPKATVVSEEMRRLDWFAFEKVKVAAVEVADS